MGTQLIPLSFTSKVRKVLAYLVRQLDRLITPQRLRLYPLFLVVGSTIMTVYSTAIRIHDPSLGGMFIADYFAHWTGGSLLLTPDIRNLYDPAVQRTFQKAIAGTDVPLSWFVSLPIVAVFYAPLSLLPYNISGLFWLALSTILLFWCLLSLRDLAPGLMNRRRSTVILTVLASPVVFELLGGGQDSAVVLAIWLIGMRLLASNHHLWAGAVFGLITAKPPLAVIVPLVFLATGNYRALGAFTCVSASLLAASVATVGLGGIEQWLGALSSPLYVDQVQHGQAWKMVGLPSFLQALLPPDWQAWATPLLTILPLPVGAVVFLVQAFKSKERKASSTALWMAALATTLTFSPHLLSYDAILFVPVIIYLLEQRQSALLRVSILVTFVSLCLMPILHFAGIHLLWPMSLIEAPWPALPLTVIWWQSIVNLREASHYSCRRSTKFDTRNLKDPEGHHQLLRGHD